MSLLKSVLRIFNITLGLLLIVIMVPIVFIICNPLLKNILLIPWSKSYVETSSKISDIGVYIGLGLCAVILIAWPFYLIKLKYNRKNRKQNYSDRDISDSQISPTNQKIINILEDLNSIIEKEMKDDNH